MEFRGGAAGEGRRCAAAGSEHPERPLGRSFEVFRGLFSRISMRSKGDEGLQMPENRHRSASRGTWCLTTHMSIFAIMQTIPFDAQWPSQSETLEAAGAVAVASMIVCCVGCSVVGILLRRRLRVPQKGQAHVLSGRRTRTFDFTRSVSEKSGKRKNKKVLEPWKM